MKQAIKWGVIGSGGIARRRTIPEGLMQAESTELISVYDTDPRVNSEVAAQFGAQACESIDSLLSSNIDAVYIASPAYVHMEQVIACAQAKKHALCEKPLGMTVEETDRMIAACKEAGVLLGVGLMMRFHSQHQAALQLLQEGKLGKPVYGRAQLSCWYPPIEGAWRQSPTLGGGGSLMDMGGHCIDLLQMYFGKIKSVSCFINNHIHAYASEDGAVATLFFEGGAMATVDTFFCIPDSSSQNVLELYGSKGSILAKNTIGQGEAGEMIAYLEGDAVGYDAAQSREGGGGIAITPPPVNTYRAEIKEFNSAIRENRPPVNNDEVGRLNQLILAACYESARSGEMVEIEYE
ncbi:MAG: Gfo/Idh/MocA family protein [Fermentimonas sp.]|jgi:predicted dehydrogenase